MNKNQFDEYHYRNPNLTPTQVVESNNYYLEVTTEIVDTYEPQPLPNQAMDERRGYWHKNKVSKKTITQVKIKKGNKTISLWDSVELAAFHCAKLNKNLNKG